MFEIRQVRESDIENVAKLYVKVYSEFLPNEGWTFETALNFCKYNFDKQQDLFFVAEEQDQVVGFSFGYIRPWSDGNQLMGEELVVDQKYHRNGIATQLFKTLVATAYDKYKITLVNGTTYEGHNQMPYSWYKRIKFNKVDDLFLVAGKPADILHCLSVNKTTKS